MDRGAWQATVHTDARVGHYLSTKQQQMELRELSLIYSVWETMCVPFITPFIALPPSSNVLNFLAKSHRFISTPEVDSSHQQSSLLSLGNSDYSFAIL